MSGVEQQATQAGVESQLSRPPSTHSSRSHGTGLLAAGGASSSSSIGSVVTNIKSFPTRMYILVASRDWLRRYMWSGGETLSGGSDVAKWR